jgi:tetratricopeptide (TPR) repeat protein
LALSFVSLMLNDSEGTIHHFLRYAETETDPVRRNATLDAIWSSGGSEVGREMYEFLEATTENSYTRLRPMALYALGDHHHLEGNEKKSRAYFDRLGTVAPWRIVGPFENISESGFDRDFGVLDSPENDASFVNKLGVPVTWIPVKQVGRQGWLHFSNHVNTNNSIVYAQTFCTSPREQETVFRLGTSGSVKVWVNDRLVFSEFHERDNHLDTYVFAAPLQRGNNRILIQIGSSEVNGSNFHLRITDRDGGAVPGLSFSNNYRAYTPGGDWELTAYPNPTEAYFLGRMEAGTAHYIDYLNLGQFYLLNGFNEEARNVFQQALDRYPKNSHLISQLIPTLRRLDDDTQASELLQQLRQDDPDHALSLAQRMEEAEELKDWPAYEQLIDTYEQRFGASETTLLWRIALAGNREETEEVFRLVSKGLREYPESLPLVLGKANLEKEVRKRPREAISILEKYLKKHYRESVVEELISLHFAAGEAREVIDLFDMLIDREPNGVNYYSRLSRLYYMIGDYRASQAMIDRALELAPYTGSLHSSLADIYKEGEDQDKAIAAYQRALDLNPYDYDSRDALRNLRSQAVSAFSVLEQPDYYAIYERSEGQEAYPDDHSAILAYDVQQVVHEGGSSEIRTSVLIKVLNEEGIDAWKEYTIPLYGRQQGVVEKVEVLDPDGSRHDASRSGTKVVFDRLQVGGAIHLVYRIQDYKFGRLSGKFWNDHPLALSYPSVQSTYSLLVPKGTTFRHEVTGSMGEEDIEPVISEVDGRQLYVWQLRDQPGIQPEAVTPNFSDLLTTVRVSNIEDWEFIANWYSELTHAKIRADENVRRAVTELFADAPAGLTERQEVERIYRFVAEDIRYISVPFLQSNYIPQSAAKTLATRQGDCKDVSSLFVAMCDVRGIDANLVLINTRNRGQKDLTLPGTGFNHCIARVELGEEPYYVELTDENLPFGTGDWSVNNAFAVVIPRKGEEFSEQAGPIDPPSRGVNSVIRTGEVTFDGGDMVFDLRNRKTNSVASDIRQTYRQESEDNRRRHMQEAISDNYPRVELTHLKFDEGLTDLTQPEVGYDYGYRVADPSTSVGGMNIYPIVLSDPLESPAYTTTAERKLPIDLWKTFRAEYYEQTLDVRTPDGRELVEVPESVEVTNDFVDYTITYTPIADGVRLKRSFRLKEEAVAPEQYAAFRDDILKIVEADKVNLAYRKVGGPQKK